MDELFDLFDEKLLGMVDGELEPDCVENDPFQQYNPFLEHFSVGA